MAMLKGMLIDNEKQKARKQEEAEAMVLQQEYAKMLQMQEEKRDKQLREIQKQQHKFNALIASTADVDVKAQEDALRAEKEFKWRQRAFDDKEAAEKQKLEHEMDVCKVAIDQQIKDGE